MSTITLPNIRVSSDLTVKLKLKDGGVALDWSTLTNIKVSIYSDAQRALAGRCSVAIDAEDSTLLVCTYAANKPQYVGVNRVVVSAKYMNETKTYDKPAFNFVRWTDDQEGQTITIDDPDIDVEISVEDVSSSILQEAVDAANTAAERANEAAEAAEHMVDIHTGPEGKSAYEVAVEEGYTGTEEEWLASLKGPVGETPDITIGTVTTAEPGTPAAASMGGTPEAPVLNLSIPKGAVGATPNFTVGTVTTGQPGTPVVVTITGTPEAPVLNVTIPQGMQGNTGSSVEFPYELVNNLTTNDATKGLSAAQGYVLDGKVSQLEAKIGEVSVPFTENKDIALGGTIGATISLTPLSESGWRYAIVDCKEGDILTVSGKGGYSTRLWGFLDIDNKLIAVSVVNLEATNLQLVAPANSAKIVVNSSTSASLKLLSCTSAQYRTEELHEEFDGRIDLLEGAVSPSVGGPELTSRQASVKGYATTAGKFQGIGTAGQVFWYIPVESGKTYRVVGTYLVAANVYANILFSADFPVNDAYGTVIDYGKGTGDAFDIHYTTPSDGYLLVWGNANNSTSIYKFYEDEIVSKITELIDVDNDIKGVIGYAEQGVQIGEFSTLKGFATGTGKFSYIGEGSAEFKYFPVTKGTKYKISGTYTSTGTYAGIIFSESVPQTDSIGIVIAVAVANQSFEEEYTAQLDGYIFVQAASFSAFYYEAVDSVVKKTDIFGYCKAGFVKLVGVAYQKLFVGNPSGTIYNSAYGSFVIPVLEGEHFLVRGRISAYTDYAVVAFSTSITPGDRAVIMLAVSQNTDPYALEYDFVSPGDGYLIVFANQTANQYGNSTYVEILKEKYRQPVISDYYLPEAFKLQTFGDSITDNTWGGKSTWVNYIPDNINIASLTVVNSGVGGAGIGGNSEHNIPNTVKYGYQRPDGRPFAPALANDADLVVIFAGTNDWAAGQPLSSTLANLADTFQYIYEHSKATVLFCTPLGRYNSVDQEAPTDANGDPLNPNGITLREESEELIKVCKRYSVPVLDLNGDAGINRFNIMDYSTDGLHPHRDGDIYVSRLICKRIKELIRD